MAMTHEDLVVKLMVLKPEETIESRATIINDALREVIKLHKPIEDNWVGSGFRCDGCDNRCGCYEGDICGDNDWATCPTIKAIEKYLNE